MSNTSSIIGQNKIFLIDDNKDMLNMYSIQFKNDGFEVFSCFDGEKIVEQVQLSNPDLIFLDLVMGEQDGLKVLQKLKSNVKTKHIPVVMLTNIDNPVDRKQCLKKGAIDYLVKVRYTPADLVSYAQGVLEKQEGVVVK